MLNRFGSKPDELFEKLQGLLRSWSSAPTASLDAPPPPPNNETTVASKFSNTAATVAKAAPAGSEAAQAHQELITQLREITGADS